MDNINVSALGIEIKVSRKSALITTGSSGKIKLFCKNAEGVEEYCGSVQLHVSGIQAIQNGSSIRAETVVEYREKIKTFKR